MARSYQPLVLRVPNGASALAVLGSWFSGLVVYSRYDGRWERQPFAWPGD